VKHINVLNVRVAKSSDINVLVSGFTKDFNVCNNSFVYMCSRYNVIILILNYLLSCRICLAFQKQFYLVANLCMKKSKIVSVFCPFVLHISKPVNNY